jgi:hypothetical protein
MVMEPNAPIVPSRPDLVIAMVKSAGVGSNPPGPSSTIPSAVTNSPNALAPPNAIGLEAVKVKVGLVGKLVQMMDVVTPFTSGEVNVIGVPKTIGEKSGDTLTAVAPEIPTEVARVGFGLSRMAAPPKATVPVISVALAAQTDAAAAMPNAVILIVFLIIIWI